LEALEEPFDEPDEFEEEMMFDAPIVGDDDPLLEPISSEDEI